MKVLAKLLVAAGIVMLCSAAFSRYLLGKPYGLLGVRTLSLIVLANTALILALLIKIYEKK